MSLERLDPITSSELHLAARDNNVEAVTRLLTTLNPNCTDNRAWTCLHEAAAHDSYESMMLILKHPYCTPLAESHEGHTALYLACWSDKSVRTITALLDSVPDIVNYSNKRQHTPLHITSRQGRTDCMELLIKYGAILDVQNCDGDTPLHTAAYYERPEAVNILLHAGADPDIRNESSLTALHFACRNLCFRSVKYLFPFITDINVLAYNGDTPLSIAALNASDKIVKYLLNNGANPNIKNQFGHTALTSATIRGNTQLFKTLLEVSDLTQVESDILLMACDQYGDNYEIVRLLLMHLGPECFDIYNPFIERLGKIDDYELNYSMHAPLNTFFYICEYVYDISVHIFNEFFYLFLMKGLSVNASFVDECPPLVFIILCAHKHCFEDVLKILIEHGCNVDYCSSASCGRRDICIPDAFLTALFTDASVLPVMLPYSLQCEPDLLLKFAYKNDIIYEIHPQTQETLFTMTGLKNPKIPVESLENTIFPLKHLARLKIRYVLRRRKGVEKCTRHFFKTLNEIGLPLSLRNYLCYN